jgi:hypothetical protein
MKTLKSDPEVVYLSSLIYRLLLNAYPNDFQREFGSNMAQVFRDCCLRAFYTRGLAGILSLWSLTLIDYIKSIFEEYSHKGVNMSTLRFIRLSGWAFIFGAAALLTSMSAVVMTSGHGLASDPYNFFSRPLDQFLAILPYIFFPSAMLLLVIGVIGIYFNYGQRVGLLGRTGMSMSIVGCVLSLVMCSIPDGWDGFTRYISGNQIGGYLPWDMAALGSFFVFSGIFIFGIEAVNRHLFLRWNLIPLLAGVLFPLRIILGYFQEATTEGWSRWRLDISMINLPMLIITAFCLIVLGYLLMSDIPQEEQLLTGNPGVVG